jgi:CheY-like chemotaxis protein
VKLPDINGLDVLRKWRNSGRAMPELILTAHNQWSDKGAGHRGVEARWSGNPTLYCPWWVRDDRCAVLHIHTPNTVFY